MFFGVLDSKDEEIDDNAAGRTDLRRSRIVVPVNPGLATSAFPQAARAPGVHRQSDRRWTASWTFVDFLPLRWLQHGSSFFHWVSFCQPKLDRFQVWRPCNKFFPTCLATGRIYLRTIRIATLSICIANAPKPPAPAPIRRAGPQSAAFCWGVLIWLVLFGNRNEHPFVCETDQQ